MKILIRRNALTGMLRWMEWTFFACGMLLLGYCAWVTADSWAFQRHATTELALMARPGFEAKKILSPGQLIGRVDVDRLGVSVAVIEGSDENELEHAAGHVIGTALPGESGNVAIAAHRDTFFRPLRNIRKNDVIRVTTPHGEYQYRVVSTQIVMPDEIGVLSPERDPTLTLITCYPFFYVGSAPKRFIVRAEKMDGLPITPAAAALQPNQSRMHL